MQERGKKTNQSSNAQAKDAGKKAQKVGISNKIELDPNNPIPFEYGGQAFAYIAGQRYIPFLYPNDDFFKTLLEAKVLSSTQTACIETKKTYCAGDGLFDINGKEFSKDVLAWLQRINAKNESAKTICRKAFGAFFTFGNVPVEIVRFKLSGKPYLYVYVHNVLEFRLAWPDQNGIVKEAIQSKLFLRQGIISEDLLKTARVLPIYDPSKPNYAKNWLVDDQGVERTLLWLKNDMDGYDYYGMPSSLASLIYQVMEYKGARYNLDNFENNMVLGGLLALKGNLSDEEAKRIAKTMISTHTGDGRKGRIAVVTSEEGIEKSDFHQYNTQSDGSYIKFDEAVVQKIIFANEWDAILAGLLHFNSMGKGNTFLRTVYQIKKTTVIDPAQQFLIINMWNTIQQIAASWNLKDLGSYELGIKDIDPISILSDVDPTPAIKVNEVREAVGLPKEDTPKGDMFLGELKASQQNQTDKSGGDSVPN